MSHHRDSDTAVVLGRFSATVQSITVDVWAGLFGRWRRVYLCALCSGRSSWDLKWCKQKGA